MIAPLVDRRRADPTRALARVLRRSEQPGMRVFGIEHEFGVFRDGAQIDFREVVHGLPIDGVAVHPTDEYHYLTPRGSAIIADGRVAEIATPPLETTRGFASSTARWADACRSEVERILPADLSLVGASTHLNVAVDQEHADRAAILYARTYAIALMLMMDQAFSPGMLVRPRPGRLELGGEYVVGESLVSAAVFAVASALAVEDHVRRQPGSLPPFVDVELEPGRRRYGWYVDRRAAGSDLYEGGRSANIRLAAGRTLAAGDYLALCWEHARSYAIDCAQPQELDRVDRLVDGANALPLERGSVGEPLNGDHRPRPHPMGIGARTLQSASVRLEPRAATWDWAAWDATTRDGSVVVKIPRASLDEFDRRLARGELDEPIGRAVLDRAALDPLTSVRQTMGGPAFFSDVNPGPGLMPNDRYGIGTTRTGTTRPGKRDLPPEESSPRSTTRLGLIAIALMVLFAGLVFGSQLLESAHAQDTQDPRSLVQSVTPIDLNGELWVVITFEQPLTEGPPFDLFSYFFGLVVDIEGGPSATIAWENHDGVQQAAAPGAMFLLDDGSVLALVSADPPPDYRATVTVESASTADEASTVARSSQEFTFDYSQMLTSDALAGTTTTYDLVNGTPVEPPPGFDWQGVATILGPDVPVADDGGGLISDPAGDQQDWYGTFDSGRPDVTSANYSSVEFGDDYPIAARRDRLTEICQNGLGAGAAPICPVDLEPLASASGWRLIDITFNGDESVIEAGLAWTESGAPTFDGPDFDANTGRNRSIEVFSGAAGYEVGATSFDGAFSTGPSNGALAVLRLDGLALVVPEEVLEGCTNATIFVVTGGGIDLVPVPETPAGTITVGTVPEPNGGDDGSADDEVEVEPPATDDGSVDSTDTDAPSDPSSGVDDPDPVDTSAPTSASDSSTTLWWVLIGVGLVVLAGGLFLFLTSRPDSTVLTPLIVGVEKGSTGSTIAARAA